MKNTTEILRTIAAEKVCSRPRRTTHPETGSLIHARCMTQQSSLCNSCSRINRIYSMRIIGSGCNVNEDDGVTAEMLAPYRFLFVTFTAPSFKATHRAGPCKCGVVHEKSDGIVSTPLDLDSYRYRDQVTWNRDSAALFKNTMAQFGAAIPGAEWTAVREWQKRGAIHFHVIIRVDDSLDQAGVLAAVMKMRTRTLNGAKWGREFDVKTIRREGVASSVSYLAKVVSYSAKEQMQSGGGRERLAMNDRLTRAAQRVKCNRPGCMPMQCTGRAHQRFGFAGHLRSNSPGWSLVGLTKAKLNADRQVFAQQMSESTDWEATIAFMADSARDEMFHLVPRALDPVEVARRDRYLSSAPVKT